MAIDSLMAPSLLGDGKRSILNKGQKNNGPRWFPALRKIFVYQKVET
jgi:hypothetical protein